MVGGWPADGSRSGMVGGGRGGRSDAISRNRPPRVTDKHGLQRRNLLIKKSHKLLERSLNGRIIYNMLNEQAWTEYINQDDPVIRHTLEVFHNNAAFPKKPAAVAKKPLTKKKKK